MSRAAEGGRRAAIVDQMLALVAEEGADRATTSRLAQRVGVSEPALYRHFPGGKNEMWRALTETLVERLQSAWQQALAEAAPRAHERLRELLAAHVRTVAETPALPAIMFSRTLHRDNAALRAAVNEGGTRLHAYLEQIVIQGCRAGDLRADLDPGDTAWLLVSVVQGTAMRWSVSGRSFDLVEEGTRLLDLALAGLRNGARAID